jgi:hypothetical protein
MKSASRYLRDLNCLMKNSVARSWRRQAALCSISLQSAKLGAKQGEKLSADLMVIAVDKRMGMEREMELNTLDRWSTRRGEFRGGIVYR